MPSSFVHTLRSLERRTGWHYWLLPALGLVAAWLTWLVSARVQVYASAPRARLEVSRMASRVVSEADGRIVTLACRLGSSVQAGEVLVELDSTIEHSEIARNRIALGSLESKSTALQQQLAAERARWTARSRVDDLTLVKARLGIEQAEMTAQHQRELATMAQELNDAHLSTRREAVTADGELQKSRILLSDASAELLRLHAAHDYEEKSDLSRFAELRRQLTDLDAEKSATLATIQTARARISRLAVRAPTDGTLGNISALQVGDVLKAGDVIATVIPRDGVRVVAEYAPELALGRIVPGQSARVRLDGFSWVEFGMLEAHVTDVASEPRAGSIRVELSIDRSALSRVPVQHGLPGSVDVRVEQTTPWRLLERSLGAVITQQQEPETQERRARESGE